jgi:ATP-dependent RNA helicase RhlE
MPKKKRIFFMYQGTSSNGSSSPRPSRPGGFGAPRPPRSNGGYGGGSSGGYKGGSAGGSRRPQGSRNGVHKQYIHPSKFVKAARAVEVEEYVPTHQFHDFINVDPLILRNLDRKNIITPTPIQDQAVPAGLEGKDVIGIANTGTGKTIAFGIPVLNSLLKNPTGKALIVAPTRELAQQIQEELRFIGMGGRLYDALLIGGASMGLQLRDLQRSPRIIIGTPGRIKDHLERGSLSLKAVTTVVLDEVDRMLDMGFINDMRAILEQTNPKHQSFFFSATMEPRVNALVQEFAHEPVQVSVKTGETTDNVEQSIVSYKYSTERYDLLRDILNDAKVSKVLIFDETQASVERLAVRLKEDGVLADAIHGGKTQGARSRALKRFKEGHINILVATDVAARGIDVKGVSHVINYSQPGTYDSYVHRVGRAGRAGEMGHAMTFVEQQ